MQEQVVRTKTVKQDVDCCIILDFPHHYRSQFLKNLGEKIDMVVVFSTRIAKERKGLAQNMPDSVRSTVLSSRPYEEIAGHPWPSIKLLFNSLLYIYRVKPRLLVVHGYYNPACWAGPLLKYWLGYRLVIWGESNEFDKRRYPVKEWAKRVFFRFAEQCHVYGASSKEYFELLGMSPSRTFITQPTVREDIFTSQRKIAVSRSRAPRRLIYAGRFEPEKNLFRLLRCVQSYFTSFPKSKLSLTLVGFGSEAKDLNEFVENANLRDRVSILGQHQQEQLAALLAQHDILVLPSTYEPYGLVVLEAMLVGLPAFVSTHCGCSVDLVNQSTGWTMDPCDTQSILHGLTAIENCGPEEFAEKVEAAIALADSYSTEASVDLTVRALLPLL